MVKMKIKGKILLIMLQLKKYADKGKKNIEITN
jgi:hypothetical protein